MRITHLITRLIVGGAQENTIASVAGLRQKPGLAVDLISGPSTGPEGSLEPSLKELGGVTLLPELVRPIHPVKDWIALQRLTRMFERMRPALVHTHSGKAGLLGRLAAERAQVPLIVHTIHGPSFGPFQGSIPNWMFRSAERRAGRETTHFVSVADAMTVQYLDAGIGRPGQFTTIRSGFDLEPYLGAFNDLSLRKKFGFGTEDVIVGKIARMCRLKGHDDLFAAAPGIIQRCPRVRFLLVGDGEWRSRFEERARGEGMQGRFVLTGLVPPSEVPPLVGIMDVLVHLSSREGLARALPQALAAGKPVVAYDCDGAKEVCVDGRTGFLLRAGDWAGLVERVCQLANDGVLRERLGRSGRELVRTQFGVDQMVNALYELYGRLAAARGLSFP
jgi:glycosyltransferase involved in cell wall biosynthesis